MQQLSGGLPPKGESASGGRGSAYEVESVSRGGLPPGSAFMESLPTYRGVPPEGDWAEPPPEPEKRAVCILLECFLVGYCKQFHYAQCIINYDCNLIDRF